ncbi:MAG TPA: DUF4389 domain-containing protein [Capillimicrobium sp.]|jgi:hypothetical protein
MDAAEHPIQIRLRDGALERGRWSVFFRLVMALPQLIWLSVWAPLQLLLTFIAWFAALFTGQLPTWAHDITVRYVRFTVHLNAYLFLAAQPWPGLMGDPGYAVDVDLPERPVPQRRWTIALRLFLVLGPALLAAVVAGSSTSVGGVLGTLALIAWFAALARGAVTPGLRDASVYAIGYGAQVTAYALLLTDRFPCASPELSRPAPMRAHPVAATLDDDLRRGRMVSFFRPLLTAPHYVWLTLWGAAALVVAVIAWLAALLTGRVPAPLHRFLAAFVRYQAHVLAWMFFAANPFPGFLGREGSYPLDVRIAAPESQHRAKTAFRLVLAVPALLLASALSYAQLVAAIGGLVAGVFTARMPSGLRDLSAWSVQYTTQTYAYALLLTDRYPDSAPTLRQAPEPAT